MKKLLLLLLWIPFLANAITLEEAERRVLSGNKALQISAHSEKVASYKRRQEKGRWYPQIGLSGDATRTAAAGNLGYATFYHSRLRFSQTVYDPDVYSDIKLSGLELAQSRNDSRGLRNDTLFELRSAYYQVVVSDKKIEVTGENISLLQEAAEREEERRETGEATLFDVNQSKVSTQNARSDYYKALREAKVARNNLLLLLGEDPVRTVELDETEIPIKKIPFLKKRIDLYEKGEPLYNTQDIWEWENLMMAKRPEIEQDRLNLELVRREEKKSALKYIPTFGLSATFVNSNVASNSFLGRNSYWDMVGEFQWTLFDGMQRENKLKEKQHSKLGAKIGYEESLQEAKAEVRNRFHEIEEALLSFVAAREGATLAEESLQQAKDRREVGEITPLEYRDAATSLMQARLDYYEASFDLLTAYYALRHTSGIDAELIR